MSPTLPQHVILIAFGLTAILLNAPHARLASEGVALLVALSCAMALWLAGNWRPR